MDILAKPTEPSSAEPAEDTAIGHAADTKQDRVRGFQVGRLRLRYMPSTSPHGFGHHEGDVVARPLFEVSLLYQEGRAMSLRAISGRHSLWLFW